MNLGLWGYVIMSTTLFLHGIGVLVFYKLIRQYIRREVGSQLDVRMKAIDANIAVTIQAVEQIVDLKNTLANTNMLLAKLAENVH